MKVEPYKIFRTLNRIVSKRLYKLNYFITYRCNSRCKICHIWKNYENIKERELNIEEIRSVFKRVKGEIFWVNLTGGEPFFREDFSEIVIAAADIIKPLILNVPTNGLLPEKAKQFIDVLKHNRKTVRDINVLVSVSIDSIAEENDILRGVKGAYARAIETFKILSSSDLIESYFQINVSGYNINTIYDILSKLSNYGPSIITFAHKADLYKNYNEDMTAENYAREIIGFIDKFIKEIKIKDMTSILSLLYLRGMKYFLINNRPPVMCTALRSTITMDPYGNILPCPYKIEPIGNIRKYEMDPFMILLTNNRISDVKRNIIGCNMCWQNCEAIPSLLAQPLSLLYKILL